MIELWKKNKSINIFIVFRKEIEDRTGGKILFKQTEWKDVY